MSKAESKPKKKGSKLRKFLLVIAVLLFLTGVGLMLFPPISNMYGKKVAEEITQTFDHRSEIVKTNLKIKKNGGKDAEQHYVLDENDTGIDYKKVDIEKLYNASVKYNQKLQKNQGNMLINDTVFQKPALYLSKYGIYDGVYGYISIPKIDLKIPIYLGIQNDHMSYGAAHLTHTSLPIGDKDSNCVLAGHTGYIGRIFFDNLRSLSKGDKVQIVNYWKKINYTVTGHKVIDPNHPTDMFIEQGKTKLVLMTCISNGRGGFNRYVVTCEKSK